MNVFWKILNGEIYMFVALGKFQNDIVLAFVLFYYFCSETNKIQNKKNFERSLISLELYHFPFYLNKHFKSKNTKAVDKVKKKSTQNNFDADTICYVLLVIKLKINVLN